jgi:O-antigen/teichoic acid export membrane protein
VTVDEKRFQSGDRVPLNAGEDQLHRKVAASVNVLFARRVVIQLLSAFSTAILARKLGVAGFGSYGAGLAMYYLALSVCDFGFGSVLARELGSRRANDGSLVRSMLRVQTQWSFAVGIGVVVFALVVGLAATRVQVLLVLVPGIALFGLSGVRQVFYASYHTARLGRIDIATNVVQLLVVSCVAFAGGGPVAVATALSAMLVVNGVIVTFVGLKLVDSATSSRAVRREMLLASLPLGLSSLLASAYFVLDLSIVGFLVSSREVGYYAAATKTLTLLVTVPMLIMTAALPGLASRAADRESLGLFSARIWHWLSVTVLPASVGLILFAPYVVTIYFGRDFSPAVPLVQILALSGIVAALSNVFGPAMVVTKRNRWLIVEGTVALAFNVGGNLTLVPRFGVTASAWLTVATEIGVCAGSAVGMRHRMVYAPLLRTSLVPAVAALAMIGTALALRPWPVVAMAVAVATFVIVTVVLGGWPVELPCPIPRRFALKGHARRAPASAEIGPTGPR